MAHKRFLKLLQGAFVSIISGFFIGAGVYAATTIGDNVTTGGTLNVTGLSTFTSVTSTSATTSSYLWVGFDFSLPAGLDYDAGDLMVNDDAFFNSQATSSVSFWIGSGGTANNIDLASGDLFVQGDAEFDGTFYFNAATGTSATTTDYLWIGSDFTLPAGLDYTGDLMVFDDAFFNSQATSSVSFWIGSGGTANNIDLASGDLFVQGDAEFDGTFYFNAATGTSATTTDYLWIGSDFTLPAGLDYTGDLMVFDDAFFNSQATSSVSFWIGSGGTASAIDLTGGDLFVQDDAEVASDLTVSGNATTTGNLTVDTNTLIVQADTNRVGIATTSPDFLLDVYSTGTTTVSFDSSDTANGACIKIKDQDGSGYTYLTVTNGAATFSATSCQ